jgi:hypothetical protein
MSRMKLHYRIGDADSYHTVDDLDDLGEALHEAGVEVRGGLEAYTGPMGTGFEAHGYMGMNFISAYWGKTVEGCDCPLSAPELARLETILYTLEEARLVMGKATYAGIDYGLGQFNIDLETGIRYGVINLNALGEYAREDFDDDYGDPHCPKCGNEACELGNEACELDKVTVDEDVVDKWEHAEHECDDYACESCEYVFGSESAYGDEPIGFTLETSEYKAAGGNDGDVMIFKSIYYTHAQFCSPCAPGAGHLECPHPEGPKTYCFGADSFDDHCPCPYPVFEVATGKQIYTPVEESDDDDTTS